MVAVDAEVELVASPTALRARVDGWRAAGERIALVPTMGNLHDGHLALIDAARARAERVVVSIFVNPLQFGPNEDFDAYPRTLDADLRAVRERGADLAFAPSVAEMYPDGAALATRVTVAGLAEPLCGRGRPGHFDGVATVVAKLFALCRPDVACFGSKDRQQLSIVARMARDLSFGIEIVAVPTVRAEDGFALSSRNGYLTATERLRAPALAQALRALVTAFIAQEASVEELQAQARAALTSAGFDVEYAELRRTGDLSPAALGDRDVAAFGAARLGSTRLIDNVTAQEIRTHD